MESLHDMPISVSIPTPVQTPFGLPGQFSIWFKSATGQRNYTDELLFHNTTKVKNNLWFSDITLLSIDSNYVKEGAAVKLFSENKFVFKGYVNRVTYDSQGNAVVRAFGSASKLDTLTSTTEYTTTTDSIVTSLASGSGMTVNTNVDLGTFNLRLDTESHLKAIAELARMAGGVFWESHIYPYDADYINFSSVMGSQTSVFTFTVTGSDANVIECRKENDYENFANDLFVSGYGDGVNQLRTELIGAVPQANITTVTTVTGTGTGNISVGDTSMFGASGNVWVGAEKCAFTKVDGTTLNLTTRAVAFLGNVNTAYVHRVGTPVYDAQYTTVSPQTGSSIQVNGLKKGKVSFPNVTDQSSLDILAFEEFQKVQDIMERIEIDVVDVFQTLDRVNLGDIITITDSEAGLSGTYECVGMNFGYSEDSGSFCTLVASNDKQTFIEQIKGETEVSRKTSDYMRGATNIYAISNYENCDATTALQMRFWLPAEAVNINAVKLNFRLKGYRAYETTSAVSSNPTVVAVATNYGFSGSINYNSWTNWATLSPSTDCERMWILIRYYLDSASELGSSDVKWRVYDGTNYYPSSSGINYAPNPVDTSTVSSHSHTHKSLFKTVLLEIPTNVNGLTITLQANGQQNSVTSLSGEVDAWLDGQHSHAMTYGINVSSLTSPSVTVKVGDDDSFGSPTTIGTYTTDQTDLDITSAVRGVGTGKWIRIQFEANKNMRIEANAYIQAFIKST